MAQLLIFLLLFVSLASKGKVHYHNTLCSYVGKRPLLNYAHLHRPLALFCLYLRVGVVTGKRLNEFIRNFESLRVEAYWVEENLDHVQSKFKFNAHGRLFILN